MPRTENRFSNSSITGGQASQDSSQGMPLAATGIGGVGTDEATKETAAELAASADELYTVIQWKWSAPHGEFVSYEKYANLTIERAFKRGQARVKVSVLRQNRQTYIRLAYKSQDRRLFQGDLLVPPQRVRALWM